MEADLGLLPRRPYAIKDNAFQKKDCFITNHCRVSFKKTTDLYQFVLDSDPLIPDDSIPVLRDLVRSIK